LAGMPATDHDHERPGSTAVISKGSLRPTMAVMRPRAPSSTDAAGASTDRIETPQDGQCSYRAIRSQATTAGAGTSIEVEACRTSVSGAPPGPRPPDTHTARAEHEAPDEGSSYVAELEDLPGRVADRQRKGGVIEKPGDSTDL